MTRSCQKNLIKDLTRFCKKVLQGTCEIFECLHDSTMILRNNLAITFLGNRAGILGVLASSCPVGRPCNMLGRITGPDHVATT